MQMLHSINMELVNDYGEHVTIYLSERQLIWHIK